ncbi:NAD(P)/FAD-dependent oxidoreductase [Actinocorallia sp. A-T 12471]|uniref:NAD(P)/FAD-dependent oxidoreductase n=1 Tax=Actinocorallia sp. A-T 12471 TaxID=3089813 RepID=UPI0029D1B648|nr:FAD-dependent oxidoreductase [Actinocorallia sp. A-T 12471]MDX6742653.1 FAD-dependent oxidoreductase [Actinocorallia sp. A-T 12471]
MGHRVVVLGGGYAGVAAAGGLARRLRRGEVEVTLVNGIGEFVERMRLHQIACGREVRKRTLVGMSAASGVRVRLGWVAAVDVERKVVVVGGEELGYDTLVYALGSVVDDGGIAGIGEHAFHVAGRDGALRLRRRLDGLGVGRRVVVVGEGLTGIETAAEIAEARPGLAVALLARGEPGAWFSAGARRHLRRAFDRLGITVHERASVDRVEADRVVAADGRVFASDATVWCGGFAVPAIAAHSGLEVAESGRIVVDAAMRSVSHPDVYAAGDSVHALGENRRPLPMSCATAGLTGRRAADAIVGRLSGRAVPSGALKYYGNTVSLGRRDAIFQMVDGDAVATSWYLGGRTAARLKSGVLKGAVWNAAHPTYGLPSRRHRLTASARSAEPDVV